MTDVVKPKGKPRGKPFAKGSTGNPHGRPKEYADLKALAREHTETAIEALVAALKDPTRSVPAAIALLDRAWGKPSISVTGEGGEGPVAINQNIAIRFVSAQIGDDDDGGDHAS